MIQNTTVQPRNSQFNYKIDVGKLLSRILRYWYLYVIFVIISGGGAYLFLKFKLPIYRVSSTILIEQGNTTPGEDLLEGFAARPGVQNIDNQIMLVSSRAMCRKAVEALPFEVDIYKKGFRSQASFYPMNPLAIVSGSAGFPYNEIFIFEYLRDNMFSLSKPPKSNVYLDTVLYFGQEIKLANGSFTINSVPEFENLFVSGSKIYISFYTKERLTGYYLSRLSVENATRSGSILRLSLQGTNVVKDLIFLDKLVEVYLNDNLEKKNQEAKRIIEFIDAQLVDVSDSLSITETQLQEFRSRNRIMDVSAQSQQIIDQAVVLENERARLNLEKNYYEYLNEYLSKEDSEKAPVAPASMGISDPLLANLMQELAGLQAQYFSSGVGERNPLQGQLESRIENTKESIKEVLQGVMRGNRMAVEENAQQISTLNSQASRLPEKERQLLGFERKFNLNNVLYTFLLQRRAEAQIQRASNTPDNEVIDKARSSGIISPNRRKVYFFAFAFALGFPTIIIVLGGILNTKVTADEDISLISELPVIGHIPHSRLSYNTVVLNEPQSIISESFRSLRNRMDFLTKMTKCPLIVVSSSMPGEGKTFTAINLASAYSLKGKKTLLIGFDLRRPTLSKSFELNDNYGISNYLIGQNSLEEITMKTDFENLFVIPAGSIPPNPAELTSSEKSINLFSILKENYDFIVVDCPPIGVVADIYPVAAISDALLLTVRHGHTRKSVLSATLSEINNNGIKESNLIVNDVKSRGNNYRYSYRYKYKYEQKPHRAKRRS